MVTNAPYYQVRDSQFAQSNSTSTAQSWAGSEHDDYDISTSAPAATSTDALHTSAQPEQSPQVPLTDRTLDENHNLAELLEAATTAQQAARAMDAQESSAIATTTEGNNSKRKRSPSPPVLDAFTPSQAQDQPGAKRQKTGMSTDPRLADGSRTAIRSPWSSPPKSPAENYLPDARAAGVHSAAALFRRPSEKTARKYTRPPMSKLFLSLGLSPEKFLQLQAKSKQYMLDPAHPERQNCVGNRGKGDTDIVKLRLFNCVRDFLAGGPGDEFFGANVEKPGASEAFEAARALGEDNVPAGGPRLTWPEDGNKIIGHVTPLMRRMVTNERQRRYAIETRKGNPKKRQNEDSAEPHTEESHQVMIRPSGHSLSPPFDPTLVQPQQVPQPAPSTMLNEALARSDLVSVPGAVEHRLNRAATPGVSTEVNVSEAELPVAGQTEHNLSNINIFLTLPAHGSKPSIKLDEDRITLQPSQKHLAWFEWDDFTSRVHALLNKAKAKYPAIRDQVAARMGNENLRGLAVAANALSGESAAADDAASIVRRSASPASAREHSPAVSAIRDAGSGHSANLLPRYVIKTRTAEGSKTIGSAKEWYDVLLEKSFDIYADGVCKVLVELVDVHS